VKIVFRTDASHQIGSGHVMRCLTLAEELRNSGAIIEFISRTYFGNLNAYIESKGFKVYSLPKPKNSESQKNLSGYEQWLGVKEKIDADETIQVLSGTKPYWLIVDQYALGEIWEDLLNPHVNKLMVIDDLFNRNHDCDLLLDQNYSQDQGRYDPFVSTDTVKLLGPKYALLRKEFTDNRPSTEVKYNTIKRVFIFFGGSDPDNLTTTALKALMQPDLIHLLVDVVIGGTNSNEEKVKALVAKRPNTELYIQVENMAEIMSRADIALGAGGTTTWERMSVGLPSIVVTIADNQVALTKDLAQDNIITWLGAVDEVDVPEIRNAILYAIQNPLHLQEQSRKGLEIISEKGTQIIAKLITVGPDAEILSVRKAKASDCLLYWNWANDPIVRENAFNQKAIDWDDHQTWFNKYLNDSENILLLIECEFGPVGQVRFERLGSLFTIDYSIGKPFRGFSLGTALLSKAINYLRNMQSFTLIGNVKDSNLASVKVFKLLGFKKSKPPGQKGVSNFLLKCSRIKCKD
jgi:UDP-2,4-diacetamido-2,4,6-trideoxy-beta-L-altropyranose hydrolase